MLWILDVAGLRAGLAAWGPRVAGVVSLLCSCLLFLPLAPWSPRSLAGEGARRAGMLFGTLP